MLNEASLVGKKTHETAAMGVARTFQNIRLFGELSVYDNIITSVRNISPIPSWTEFSEQESFEEKRKKLQPFPKRFYRNWGCGSCGTRWLEISPMDSSAAWKLPGQ